jgi:hypothetical protein
MALFWIVHTLRGRPTIFLAEAGDQVTARLKALLAGLDGEFAEIHRLDPHTAKRVPDAMRRRALNQREAESLLREIA